MGTKAIAVLLASALGGCMTPGPASPDRGVASVNQPVLNRATYVVDVAAPGGVLGPAEVERLGGWFQSLDVGYGDSIFVDGDYSGTARAQVSNIAGHYGLMVLADAPVTVGAIPPGTVRVVVSRTRAEVPNCPNWTRVSQPNFENRSMSNFGCAVNSDLAAMVANPQDLFQGRAGSGVGDAFTGAKAVEYYRKAPLTGAQGLTDINTKKDKQ